jgi:hypothetical protein
MMANRMIEYMAALKFVSQVPGCRLSNISLPEWGIEIPAVDSPGPVAVARDEQHLDIPRLSAAMRSGEIARVEWAGYGQRMENFLPREAYRDVFVAPSNLKVGFGHEYLVCHIRAGEILDDTSPDYPLTPVEFYADLVAETGLKPVFMGQTARNAYTDRIRDRFPHALFLDTQDVVTDFETIRRSKNVVVGIGTFAWLAAWLSTEADTVFMAVNGIVNPMQRPVVDLVPYGDNRYRFYLFPINYAVDLDRHAAVHRGIAPYWRHVTHDALRTQVRNAPRFERSLDAHLAVFDEAHYRAAYGDIDDAINAGWLRSGRDHYALYGFLERQFPFPLDKRWYAAAYPMAGFEVAQGDYTDFAHHYLAVGKARGYRPLPLG